MYKSSFVQNKTKSFEKNDMMKEACTSMCRNDKMRDVCTSRRKDMCKKDMMIMACMRTSTCKKDTMRMVCTSKCRKNRKTISCKSFPMIALSMFFDLLGLLLVDL